MLLSYVELVELVERGVIRGVKDGAINGASIDVHLGPEIRVEEVPYFRTNRCIIDLGARETIATTPITLGPDGHLVNPGEFFLGATEETFFLPNDISCQFLLKSTIGRAGLNHMAATWADATWYNSNLTLEFKNDTQGHTLQVRAGMPIGQMKFYKHTPVPDEHSYARKGRYNNDFGPVGGKK